jgi:hypothetical protein
VFENSPVWRNIERQQRMFDRIFQTHATLATAAFSSQAKRIAEMVTSPAFSQITDLVTTPAFTLATEQIGNIVRPALEKASSQYEKIGEELSASALANLKPVNVRLAEELFNTRILADEALMKLAFTSQLGSHIRLGFEGAFQDILQWIPELEFEPWDEDEVPDQALPTPASVTGSQLLSPEEWLFLGRATWVMFLVALTVIPEGRDFLNEISGIVTLITAILLWYPPHK